MIPRRFFWLLDFSVVAFAFCLAYALWPGLHGWMSHLRFPWLPATFQPEPMTGTLPPYHSIGWALLLAGTTAVIALEISNAYQPLLQQSRMRLVITSIIAPVAAGGVITLVLYLQKIFMWSRLFLVSFMALGAAFLLLYRGALRQYFLRRRAAGFYTKNVLVVGRRDVVRWLVDYSSEAVPVTEYRITGFLACPGDPHTLDPGVPMVGTCSELGNLLIRQQVDEVVAIQSLEGGDWIPDVIETCDSLGILLRIVPQGLLFGKRRVLRTLYPFQMLHLPSVVLAPPHFDSDAVFFKRVFDIAVSGISLVLLSPLFAIIAVLIKISDPRAEIFYRWNVVGRNGVRFTGYKFTTMYADADERRNELLAKNEMTGPVFKIKSDPRVTPLGRFLRKYSLNELPQLWSVLKGDMSLVGPRPAFPHELEGYGMLQKRKLSIRPGITCLWQVSGRNKISNFDDWVKLDLEYIDNWSLWLDVKILARTAWAVVAGTGS